MRAAGWIVLTNVLDALVWGDELQAWFDAYCEQHVLQYGPKDITQALRQYLTERFVAKGGRDG